jgi:hypothetical protein
MGFFDWLTGGKKSESKPQPVQYRPINTIDLSGNPICASETCAEHVFKPEHTHCYTHWKIGKTQRKEHERKLGRKLSPSQKRNYNQLISSSSPLLGKSIESCDEQTVLNCLITKMGIHPGHAAAFTSSDGARGVIGWAPPLDKEGLENEGYEWTDFKGAKWYRSLSQPGPWTRHG